MTSPRSTYGGGYYSASSFADTPIYDSLVAERGTPQIAPIRVPAQYDTPGSNLPALPSALPALPAGPSQSAYGYPQAQQPSPLQQAPNAYIPQQVAGPRGYPGAQPQQQQQRPMAGYEAMRPAAPRPAPSAPYQQDPYNGQQYRGY
ncbi:MULTISPECIES: DUF6643 family protein [Streptomyces]|jgi:hypothetical protein|uniref:Uncharacterized protein n=3 Tax=Streptomyces TaxID=1883 RepID=M3DM96_9ACTN|nr:MULTISPECIES: DUF6643 family protein [Streptomyces]EMF58072.1 hypothetical protein SBD_0744 [Streptomyces bottropensis ATCC 25435]KND46518.1 hypothetical protein IQ64_00870 [Streptomyces stelliscabiei]MBE1595031.1 hypothetical protein [Streptomyces stelliscabiei]MDX2516000.1 hypothetical protein [Streptomyces stelliscabiei]MDX2552973.1 hypothetical protein [Streptomyces stelliscabiei]